VDFSSITGYTAYVNVGEDQRGTATLVKEGVELTDITRLPPRGMFGFWRHIGLVNIYAPSGTSKRIEREKFYQADLAYLLRSLPNTLILGGDFNLCCLQWTVRVLWFPEEPSL
jgi:exonuclease III